MIEGGGTTSNDEKDTDTFLTGTNVQDGNVDNMENSQALVE